jgi:hypothetical protein
MYAALHDEIARIVPCFFLVTSHRAWPVDQHPPYGSKAFRKHFGCTECLFSQNQMKKSEGPNYLLVIASAFSWTIHHQTQL